MKKEFRIAILIMLVISVLASGCSKNKSANVYRDSDSYYTEEYEYAYDDPLANSYPLIQSVGLGQRIRSRPLIIMFLIFAFLSR